jgi:LCP family protein required for cell wall assembly
MKGERAGVNWRRVVGRAGYALCCVAAVLSIAASSLSATLVSKLSSFGWSSATSGSSTGAQNILVMGIESRRYWNGDILPWSILKYLHAGNRRAVADGAGGDTTNTLILIHLFANGKKAIGFSIPRNDYVDFASTAGPQQQGMIDQAYGLSMYYEEGILRQKYPHMGKDELARLGNEAGQKATIATVEKLTGVHVDHFVDVNMWGFYELAKAVGGVEVCLKHATRDPNSGADFRAGYQHLDAAQALAFVRQRDGLVGGDLARTHRQQAFIDAVIQELRGDGVLSAISKIEALLSTARLYLITDRGWNLLDFAEQTAGLSPRDITFHTLPIKRFATIYPGGEAEDINVINPVQIKAIVQGTFYPKPGTRGPTFHVSKAAASKITVDVLNGGQTAGLARNVSTALIKEGYRQGRVADAPAPQTATTVLYGSGASASGRKLAGLFHTTPTASTTVAPDHVEIVLGATATMPHIAATPHHRLIPATGLQGGAVHADNGIPCVN